MDVHAERTLANATRWSSGVAAEESFGLFLCLKTAANQNIKMKIHYFFSTFLISQNI